jgi:hypothetical protein
MTEEDVKLMKRWMTVFPDELFPMSIVYLYPDLWREIIQNQIDRKERELK